MFIALLTLVLAAILVALIVILVRQEKFMAQLDDLNAVVVSLGSDVNELQADVLTVINLLQAVPPTVDLSDPIAKLQAIHNVLGTVDASLKAVEPAPPVVTAGQRDGGETA